MIDEAIKFCLIYIVIPVFTLGSSIGAFFMKSMIERIKELEDQMTNKLSEAAVRQIVADKVDPLKEDLKEIKDSLNQIFHLLLKADK
jgi:hypothetical protein